MIIKGLTFIKTCVCCPEQYDIKDNKGNKLDIYVCVGEN